MCRILLQSVNLCVKTLTHKKKSRTFFTPSDAVVLPRVVNVQTYQNLILTRISCIVCCINPIVLRIIFIDSNKQQRLWVVL